MIYSFVLETNPTRLACVSGLNPHAHALIVRYARYTHYKRSLRDTFSGFQKKGAFMINKRPWWQKEFLSTQTNQEIIQWLETQNKIKEWKDKEKLIIQAYQKKISKKRDQILKLTIEIKELEKECNQCLAKISTGDIGLIKILAEKNSLK